MKDVTPRPSTLGGPRVHLRRTDSTSDRLRALALRGAPHGTLVTAEEQTAGRGRHGRRWWAPARTCLLMSLLLRWPASQGPPALLSLSAAVAVCDVAGPDALVKWPNDIVVRGPRPGSAPHAGREGADAAARTGDGSALGKLAGILIEGRPGDGWAMLGIGLNVALDLAYLPADVRGTAATLGRPAAAIEPTLFALLRALEGRLRQQPQEILAAWRARDALLGAEVAWGQGGGRAEGVDDGGRLLVRRVDGSVVRLDSGEVRLARGREAPAGDPQRKTAEP